VARYVNHAHGTLKNTNQTQALCDKGLCGFRHIDASTDVRARRFTTIHIETNYRFPGSLPQSDTAKVDHIPVNKYNQRLDYYLRHPDVSDYKAYEDRFPDDTKPCSWFSLTGRCHSSTDCPYEHTEVSSEVLKIIRYGVKTTPCWRGSLCRRLNCIYGHVCQDPECIDVDTDSCSMRMLHPVDPVFHSWAPGEMSKFDTNATDVEEEISAGSFRA
jgi:hypothetical protein